MHLFHSDFSIVWDWIHIENQSLAHQMRNVLRRKNSQKFFIQKSYDNQTLRIEVKLRDISWSTILWEIQSSTIQTHKNNYGLIVGMPNKRSKIEYIIQKCTEIGITDFSFCPMQRSIIKKFNSKKSNRLKKIAHEAVEQSRWRQVPTIQYYNSIHNACWKRENIYIASIDATQSAYSTKFASNSCLIVWPEWWFTAQDEKEIATTKYSYEKISFNKNILRTETACIVGSWILLCH